MTAGPMKRTRGTDKWWGSWWVVPVDMSPLAAQQRGPFPGLFSAPTLSQGVHSTPVTQPEVEGLILLPGCLLSRQLTPGAHQIQAAFVWNTGPREPLTPQP